MFFLQSTILQPYLFGLFNSIPYMIFIQNFQKVLFLLYGDCIANSVNPDEVAPWSGLKSERLSRVTNDEKNFCNVKSDIIKD